MAWVWKIFPKIIKFFNFFPFGSKKISLGWVKKDPGPKRVGLLFTAGLKYAQFGSLFIPYLVTATREISISISNKKVCKKFFEFFFVTCPTLTSPFS